MKCIKLEVYVKKKQWNWYKFIVMISGTKLIY